MIVIKEKSRQSLDDKLVPLINIVFLLLIFFMVAGRIEQSHKDDIDVPKVNSSNELPSKAEEIVLLKNGKILSGERVFSVEEFTEQLPSLGLEKEYISIRADSSATAEQLAPIIKTLNSIGQKKIGLIAMSRGDNESD